MQPDRVPDFIRDQHPHATFTVIGKPPGYSDDEIGGLPACIDRSEPRFPAILSYWKPNEIEMKQLIDGGHVELEVIAHQMVPVSMNVVSDVSNTTTPEEGS